MGPLHHHTSPGYHHSPLHLCLLSYNSGLIYKHNNRVSQKELWEIKKPRKLGYGRDFWALGRGFSGNIDDLIMPMFGYMSSAGHTDRVGDNIAQQTVSPGKREVMSLTPGTTKKSWGKHDARNRTALEVEGVCFSSWQSSPLRQGDHFSRFPLTSAELSHFDSPSDTFHCSIQNAPFQPAPWHQVPEPQCGVSSPGSKPAHLLPPSSAGAQLPGRCWHLAARRPRRASPQQLHSGELATPQQAPLS